MWGVLTITAAELFLNPGSLPPFLTTALVGAGVSDILNGTGTLLLKPLILKPLISMYQNLKAKVDAKFDRYQEEFYKKDKKKQKKNRKPINQNDHNIEETTQHFVNSCLIYGTHSLNTAASLYALNYSLNKLTILSRRGINPFGFSMSQDNCGENAWLCMPLLTPVMIVTSVANGLYNMKKMIEYYKTGTVRHKDAPPLFRIFNGIIYGMTFRYIIEYTGDYLADYSINCLEKKFDDILRSPMRDEEKIEIAYQLSEQLQKDSELLIRSVKFTEGFAHWIITKAIWEAIKNGTGYIGDYLRSKQQQEILKGIFDNLPEPEDFPVLPHSEKRYNKKGYSSYYRSNIESRCSRYFLPNRGNR